MQNIIQNIKRLEDSLKFEKDLQANYKKSIEASVERVIDINEEITELQSQISEEDRLIDQIKNPEDYADFDLKDLESSQ